MVQKPPRSRGRPRTYDADTALDQARDAFWDAGYAATSLDTLAAATGMARPSLYLAFGDKRALYRRTLERYLEAARAALAEELAPERPLRDAVAAIFRRSAAQYLAGKIAPRGCLLISTAVPEATGDPELRAWLRDAFAALDAAFIDRMRLGASRGELPPGADPEALGRLAASLMYSLSVRARGGARQAELEAIAAESVTLLFGTPTPPGGAAGGHIARAPTGNSGPP
jgi:AcrR family transcriptional regulator